MKTIEQILREQIATLEEIIEIKDRTLVIMEERIENYVKEINTIEKEV